MTKESAAIRFLKSRGIIRDGASYTTLRDKYGAKPTLRILKGKRRTVELEKRFNDCSRRDFSDLPRHAFDSQYLDCGNGFAIVVNFMPDDSGYDFGDSFGKYHFRYTDDSGYREGVDGIIAERNCSARDLDRHGDFNAWYKSDHCTWKERLAWARKSGLSRNAAWHKALSDLRAEAETFRKIGNESAWGYSVSIHAHDDESETWSEVENCDSCWGFTDSDGQWETIGDTGAIDSALARVAELADEKAQELADAIESENGAHLRIAASESAQATGA